MAHKDYFGKDIEIGDFVVHSGSSNYAGFNGVWQVKKLTEVQVSLVRVAGGTPPKPGTYPTRTSVRPELLLVINDLWEDFLLNS